jgi:hypothetical protein
MTVSPAFVAGTNITLSYDDPGNKLTINGTGHNAGGNLTPGGNLVATNAGGDHRAGSGEGGQGGRPDEWTAWH